MAETGISDLKRAISHLGVDPETGKCGSMVFAYVMTVTVLIINSIFYVAYKWDDVSKRLEGVKGLVLYLLTATYLMGLTSHWDETMLLINTIENGLYKYSYRYTAKCVELKSKIENGIAKLRSIWNYMLNCYLVALCSAPLVILVFRVIQNSAGNVTVDTLYTALPFYYPENYKTIAGYVVAYSLQCFLTRCATWNAYVVLVSAFNSMQMIEGELKVLRQSLQDIDSIGHNYSTVHEDWEQYCKKNTNHHSSCDRNMKGFLQYFLKHHYNIHRKVEKVTRGIQLIGFSINSGMSVLLCTSIYSLARSNDIMIMLNEAVYITVGIFCLYCYGLMGERISTEDEKLRKALYDYMWIDKPQWFKRSLLIIMTRTTRMVEMKSLGLFTLNLRNYLATLQAAYSYFNLINSLK